THRPPRLLRWYLSRHAEAACGESFRNLHRWDESMFAFPLIPGARRALGVFRLPAELRICDRRSRPPHPPGPAAHTGGHPQPFGHPEVGTQGLVVDLYRPRALAAGGVLVVVSPARLVGSGLVGAPRAGPGGTARPRPPRHGRRRRCAEPTPHTLIAERSTAHCTGRSADPPARPAQAL